MLEGSSSFSSCAGFRFSEACDHDETPRSEALFYYFRLEDQVFENHLPRLIDKHISSEFVQQQLKDRYSETGRPSIDPELLLRMRQCVEVGLARGNHLSVDGSFVKANAARVVAFRASSWDTVGEFSYMIHWPIRAKAEVRVEAGGIPFQ